MNGYFADTFYWIALINPSDQYASSVSQFDDVLSAGVVWTTEEVLAEVLTFFAGDPWLRNRATLTVGTIILDPNVQVVHQSHASFIAGFELYAARPDKRYSLTDCISMQTMKRQGLSDVLTNDRHFEQEAFRALFK